jgi:hypothetical protein
MNSWRSVEISYQNLLYGLGQERLRYVHLRFPAVGMMGSVLRVLTYEELFAAVITITITTVKGQQIVSKAFYGSRLLRFFYKA